MRIPHPEGTFHLTYCTNVHPGERLGELERVLEGPVRAVKARVAPDRPMGLGLWLPAAALSLLQQGERLAALRDRLEEGGFYLFTVNGFPYGRFHGTRVKEAVYQPDWRRAARAAYTRALADLLAGLIPEDLPFASLSTVPGSSRQLAEDPASRAQIVAHLMEVAAHLHQLHEERGRTIVLALEPEPGCLLQSSEDTLRFFREHLWTAEGLRPLCDRLGVSLSRAEDIARRHLGLCFDVCHFAVAFEDPASALATLAEAGIRIAKLQLSCALRVAPAGEEGRAAVKRFDDGIYLHQTTIRSRDGSLHRFLDLPAALAAELVEAEEWRVHVHLPIYAADLEPPLASTQPQLAAAVRRARRLDPPPHFEVETYNFAVLPEELRALPLEEALARELAFARELLSS